MITRQDTISKEMDEVKNKDDGMIEEMFKAGAHYAFSRSRRHPTLSNYIFGVKNRVEIFDLEKTKSLLEKALDFVRQLAKEGKQILFVGGKNEARASIKQAAISIGMPYVDSRWIGGSITNFREIRSRVDKLLDLTARREKGELAKYTKKERLLIDRDIANLERFFSGIIPMKELPKAIFVVDPKHESTAANEARKIGIPLIALLGSDCDLKTVDYPIPGNDASVASIRFFVDKIVWAYKEGVNERLQMENGKIENQNDNAKS